MPLKGRSNVDKAIAMMREGANDDIKGVYLAGMKNMIEQTPARSGGTRNSWQLSVGAPKFVYNESTGTAERATNEGRLKGRNAINAEIAAATGAATAAGRVHRACQPRSDLPLA